MVSRVSVIERFHCILRPSHVLYSRKFSRDPIFAERLYAKISRSNFSRMGDPSSENVHLGFYFADLIFVVCQSTAKIGSLENFRLYGISFIRFSSPFLKAKNSKMLCTILTIIVRPRRYGFVSSSVVCICNRRK